MQTRRGTGQDRTGQNRTKQNGMNQFTDIAKQLKNTFDPYINVDIKLWDAFAGRLQLRKFKKNEVIKDADQTEHYIISFQAKGVKHASAFVLPIVLAPIIIHF